MHISQSSSNGTLMMHRFAQAFVDLAKRKSKCSLLELCAIRARINCYIVLPEHPFVAAIPL